MGLKLARLQSMAAMIVAKKPMYQLLSGEYSDRWPKSHFSSIIEKFFCKIHNVSVKIKNKFTQIHLTRIFKHIKIYMIG
jgi:hypothetical protein